METQTIQTITDAKKSSSQSGHARPLLLLVDDIDFVHMTMKPLLESRYGARVLSAHTSEEALQTARRNPKLGLVISDICRPGMDGLTFLGVFKKEHPSIPVIMVSGAVNKPVRQRAYRLGASACHSKPVKLSRLMGAITRTLRQTGALEA